MSFILDALKKSENDRQEQAETEFATVPTSPDAPAVPRWLWVLGGLLTINVVVVLGLVLRPDSQPYTSSPITMPASEPAAAAAEDNATFSNQVAEARKNQPDRSEPEPIPSPETSRPAQSTIRTRPTPVPVDNLPTSIGAALPSLMELRADGTLQLPELHVDIHVYSDVPAERFVFINMDKHREDSRIDEGPVVREITPDGVILEYQGRVFLLPRE